MGEKVTDIKLRSIINSEINKKGDVLKRKQKKEPEQQKSKRKTCETNKETKHNKIKNQKWKTQEKGRSRLENMKRNNKQ